MKFSKYLLMLVLIMPAFFGCVEQPLKQYKINLIKPDGKIYKTYTDNGIRKPILNCTIGGQVECVIQKTNYKYDQIVVAPVGWAVEIEE